MSDQQDSATIDEEIKALKVTIKRLQDEPASELKQAALQALKDGNTVKAVDLMEESAQTHTTRTEKLSKEAALDWIDIGNISYLNNSQKALNAYEKAINLAPSNPTAWNLLGTIQRRLGNLDEAQHAYEEVLKLAGGDKTFQAKAYGNLGIIYYIRGKIDKAEEFHLKSLDINKKLGRQEGMASDYGNLSSIYITRGELDKAEEFLLKALDIDKKLGILEGMAFDYSNLGIIYEIRGELDKACETWQTSLQLFTNIGAQDKIDLVRGCITRSCKE